MISNLRRALEDADWVGSNYARVDKILLADLIIILENISNGGKQIHSQSEDEPVSSRPESKSKTP